MTATQNRPDPGEVLAVLRELTSPTVMLPPDLRDRVARLVAAAGPSTPAPARVETREEWAILSREVGDDAEGIEMCEDEHAAHRQLALHYSDRRFRYARVVRRDQPVAPEAPWVEVSPSTPAPAGGEPRNRLCERCGRWHDGSGQQLVGWRNVTGTGHASLPKGHMPPDYRIDAATGWEPIYGHCERTIGGDDRG